jgi:hypothetical protein
MRSGSEVDESGDAVLLGDDGGDDEVHRSTASSMVVVAWTNWLRGLVERQLEGGGVCGDVGSIAAAWGCRNQRRWYEVRVGRLGYL